MIRNVKQRDYPSIIKPVHDGSVARFQLLCCSLAKRLREKKFTLIPELELMDIECPACHNAFGIDRMFFQKAKETNFKYSCPYCAVTCNISDPD